MPPELTELFRNPWFYLLGIVIGYFANKILPLMIESFENRRLEVFKRDLLRREKADRIAELLVLLQKAEMTELEKDKVDEILYHLCLLLPPCLIHKMAHTVCKSGKQLDVNPYGLLVEIKSYIEGNYKRDKKIKLDSGNIPHTKR